MKRLNPFNAKRQEIEKKDQETRSKTNAKERKNRRKSKEYKKGKQTRNSRYRDLCEGLEKSFKDAEDEIKAEIKAGQVAGEGDDDEEEDSD